MFFLIIRGSSWPQATRGDANARASAEVGERGRMSVGMRRFDTFSWKDRMVFNAGWCGLRDRQGTSECLESLPGLDDMMFLVWWLDNVKIVFFLVGTLLIGGRQRGRKGGTREKTYRISTWTKFVASSHGVLGRVWHHLKMIRMHNKNYLRMNSEQC